MFHIGREGARSVPYGERLSFVGGRFAVHLVSFKEGSDSRFKLINDRRPNTTGGPIGVLADI